MSAEKWEKYRLGDNCLKIGSGATPRGGQENYKTDHGKPSPKLLAQCDEWIFDSVLHDWQNLVTGELLTGYHPAPQLQWILGQSIDVDLD